MIDAPGRRIGYARVSTKDQKLRMQLDGLRGAGCDPIFEDHGVSGKLASRSGLASAPLANVLLELELSGKIAPLPGNLYQRLGP